MSQSYISNIPIILWSSAILVAGACSSHYSETQSKNLARVGDQYLTIEQARQAIPAAIYREDSTYALQQYRQQWIEEQLLLKEANAVGLDDQKAVQSKIKNAREEILRDALRAYVISTEVDSTITDQEVESYFNAHKKHFVLQEPYVQFRHMQTPSITDARAAQQALRDSMAWEEVARQYSANPKNAIKESKRFYPLSMALADIDIMQRYLGSISVGDISAIQRLNGTYHFVQLTGRREQGSPPDLAWLRDEVRERLLLEKRQRKFNSFLKNLYLKAESDNEIESYNVLSTQTNPKNSTQDTLESNSTDE